MTFLEELASRRRFGIRPGLETIRAACTALGDPQMRFKAIHVAGTNGKGAVCALLDAALRERGLRVGRYTSPHLVRLNERFFLEGVPVDDAILDRLADRVRLASFSPFRDSQPSTLNPQLSTPISELTFFEALTAVAYLLYAEAGVDHAVLECGLGGRLDATNVCNPELCVITKVGLDHCDWLGDTVEKIAAEKAGIVKPGVPVVLGRNEPSVRAVVETRAKEVCAPFFYVPDLATADEIPENIPLGGTFNRENAVTALAALKVLVQDVLHGEFDAWREFVLRGMGKVVWPGRFQRVGDFIVDGAHNPPAARALRESLERLAPSGTALRLNLIAGFCGDKDVDQVLSILAPVVGKGYAVRTNNPRSLSAEATAAKMRSAGMDAVACDSLADAIRKVSSPMLHPSSLVCGSLFLAGEALVELGAYPWLTDRFDPSESLRDL